jgi:hypothetical protein
MYFLTKSLMLRALILLISTLPLGACFASIKPIYYAKEQAKAERAVDTFHRLHNEGRFQEIYILFDDATRAGISEEQFLSAAKKMFDECGKVRSATLSEAKVFPGTPLQVRMIYNVKFEKVDAQEWIIWNIRGDDVRLFHQEIKPGFDTPPNSKK